MGWQEFLATVVSLGTDRKMLCPHCLQNIDSFEEVTATGGGTGYRCSRSDCRKPVPFRYVQDYFQYPPVLFSLIGFKSHGKSVFLGSLFCYFDRMALDWPDFSYTPLDDSGLAVVRNIQRQLEAGELPDVTPENVFSQPVILRLDGLPPAGRCHLVMYDTSGGWFTQVRAIKHYASFLTRTPTVTWLVSIPDLTARFELSDLLTLYLQSVLELGGRPKSQTLLVALTKGDLLVSRGRVPATVTRLLHNERSADPAADLLQMSNEIEAWLARQPGFAIFVRRARQEFAQVRYCIVSALGSPRGENFKIRPQRVLAPVQWNVTSQKSWKGSWMGMGFPAVMAWVFGLMAFWLCSGLLVFAIGCGLASSR